MNTTLFILIALAAVFGTGCSGINYTKSVSPLDFILPGLMQNTPSIPPDPSGTNGAPLLATNSKLLLPPVDVVTHGSQHHRWRVNEIQARLDRCVALSAARFNPQDIRRSIAL